LAGFLKTFRLSLPFQAEKTITASVKLLGVAVLLKDAGYQFMEYRRFLSCLLAVVFRAPVSVVLVLRAKVIFGGRVTSLMEAPDMHSYLFSFVEDVNHAAGIDDLDPTTNQFIRHTVIVFIHREEDVVILGHPQLSVVLDLVSLFRQRQQVLLFF
jgi:hypothetical protein